MMPQPRKKGCLPENKAGFDFQLE